MGFIFTIFMYKAIENVEPLIVMSHAYPEIVGYCLLNLFFYLS